MASSTLGPRSATIVVIVLTATLVILFLQLPSTSRPWSSSLCVPCSSSEWSDEHEHSQSEATHLTADVPFTLNRFLLNFSHTMDEKLTERLRPKNTGLIWTTHNETMRLPMGISMFHAMHCILFLREMLQERIEMADGHFSDFKSRHGEDLHTHIPHCFSYVTQHIMCLGDSTIEPPWIDTDGAGNIKAFGIDGVGIEHKCKDTSRIIDMARRTRTETFQPWEWQAGDTVESVFGD